MIRPITLLAVLSAATSPTPIALQDPSAAPVAQHERLAALAGDWTVVSTFDLPGSAPQEFAGTARGNLILGGRFVQVDESAVEFGQPSAKQKTFGFNTASKKWEGVWMYTGSTAVMQLTGTASKDGKAISGDASFAGAEGTPQTFTWDLQFVDADHFSTRLVAPAHDGRQAATFTAVYTRAMKK